jgi:hypothetical protein
MNWQEAYDIILVIFIEKNMGAGGALDGEGFK